MSFGDEIMASGHALTLHRETGARIRIVGRDGKPRWSDLWAGLPWIIQPSESGAGAIELRNGPGCRPYIEYPFSRESGCRYSGWRARDHVGAIYFTAEEEDAADFALGGEAHRTILVEPHVPPQSNPNKQWGWDRWQALASLLIADGFRLVQVGQGDQPALSGVRQIVTPTFRFGAAVLARVVISVLPEGGLHHAAAATGRRAVVLFGGSPSVEATGYPGHINIADDDPRTPCGTWSPCDHCAAAWERITPAGVAAAVTAAL